jgi:hypothetical protein
MIEIRAFRPEDLLEIEVQAAQASYDDAGSYLNLGAVYAGNGPAVTIIRPSDGAILCIAGLIIYHHELATLWAFMTDDKGNDFVAITRALKVMIDHQPFARIDAYVHADYLAGRRWIKILGLEYEARLRGHAPDGGDHCVYFRLKEI